MAAQARTVVTWRGGKPRAVLAVAPGVGLPAVPYESGATQGPRMRRWLAPGAGPNLALNFNLQTLRNRSRQAERNNPWLWRAIDALVTNEVGIGVTLRSAAADEAFRDTANALWALARNQLDPAGILNFGGLQEQAVRGRRVAGEVFIRRRWPPQARWVCWSTYPGPFGHQPGLLRRPPGRAAGH